MSEQPFPPLVSGDWGRPVTWDIQLDSVVGKEEVTNSVTIYSRPVLRLDGSGAHGFEKFAVVTLTKAEVVEILAALESDLKEMREHCPGERFV